ncbi:MAG: heme NO-binding domain-containing protein [Saprospiraceae bacterium]|nr:heme NO-binding domain-containing protein [Saprospiraceae bacterium]MDG1433299.1 heme NO-binding domain-containing protein [Saprospiraceae bacterium]MDG2418861.1 heme NO-binding domain-containing protein [Saprospiraceae bacterium]
MYGIVNKGIRDLVIRDHGEDVWDEIVTEAGCKDDFFMSMEVYDDSITYNLVGAASKVLKTPSHDLLVLFGEFWMVFTAAEGYGSALQIAGSTFPQFLGQLDNLHRRLGTTYNKLKPPSFVFEEIDDQTLLLQYHSHRKGLTSFAIGIIRGLGKKFKVDVEVKLIKKQEDFGYDEFLLKYIPIKNEMAEKPNLNTKKQENEKPRCPYIKYRRGNQNISTN